MARDPFLYHHIPATGPALGSIVITPSDSTDLPTHIRAVTLASGGTLSWLDRHGAAHVTAELPAGTYPLLARRILATGTTATGITGWV